MENLLYEFVVISLLSGIVIFVCNKIKVPPIVGFLLTGALFGPSALGLVREMEAVKSMADIGVVFLLFTIGMELSISELVRLKKPVFMGGTIQVFATIAAMAVLASLAGIPLNSAVFIGFLFALSSTAIVLNIMQQRLEVETPGGRISLAILIYQDLIIVPMMLAIPILAGTAKADAATIGLTLARTLGIAVLLFLLTRKIVPKILAVIVGTGSRELFLITILGICLGTAYLTSLLGLSLTLGAFMAGLVVAESEYSYNALDGMIPFQYVFTSIFFVSMGMLLDMGFFIDNIGPILLVVLIVLAVKGLVAGADVLLMRYPLRPAVIVALSLGQVGEFSFVLAKTGLDEKLITDRIYQYFLAVSILTMAATPFLIALGPKAANLLDSLLGRARAGVPPGGKGQDALEGHTLIIGYGPAGKLCSWGAAQAKLPYVVIEMNPDTVRACRRAGVPIYYGDAEHMSILEHHGIHRAAGLVIAISDPEAVYSITQTARHLNKDLHILSRVRFMSEIDALKKEGADEVVAEDFETSVELLTRFLAANHVPGPEIGALVRRVRAKTYQAVRDTVVNEMSMDLLQEQMPLLVMKPFTVGKGSPLDGKTFREAGVHDAVGVTVVALKRAGRLIKHPSEDFRFQPDDEAYGFLSLDDIEAVGKFFATPPSVDSGDPVINAT